MSQGAQLGALEGQNGSERWEAGSVGRRYMYTYS